KTFRIAMYPWFAIAHITPFIHMANKLAQRGHKISFFLPAKTLGKVEAFNLYPDLITFIPIIVPHVEGLPVGAETTNDPHFVFFDFTCWMPALTRKLGIKSVLYCIISSGTIGYILSPARKILERGLTGLDLLKPPKGFPSSSIKLRMYEAQGLAAGTKMDYGSGISFAERHLRSFSDCDAIAFKTCKEIEGPYCEYIGNQFEKPMLYAGPVVPEPQKMELEERWKIGPKLGLNKDQSQELVLGLELTGLPFLSALSEGFQERVNGRGFIYRGWIPQQLILRHISVGCFVTHCVSGSLAEAMVNDCQLVLVPHVGDQIINARLMAGDLRIGVEVEKGEEDGLFTKDDVNKVVKALMDDDSELGKEIRANHAKWKEFLLAQAIENSYMNDFVINLNTLV
ncbi:hypothetical protein E1A91_A06G221000v1, partial [Gossypium mustelinum]